jgi:hypothetical protein
VTTEEKTIGQTSIAEYSETAAALAMLRENYAGVIYDVTQSKEMKAAKEARAELRGLRTSLEKKRVEIKAPALERCRLIDSEAKRITAELVALEEPIDVQIKAEEARAEAEKLAKLEAERLRVAALQSRIDAIRNVATNMVGKPSVIIAGQLSLLEAETLDEAKFAELYAVARDALDASIARVRQLHTDQVAHEAEQKKIAAEREELARMRAENERLQREAEERAAADRAEQDRLAQAERDRVAAEERAQRAAEQAEQDRLAAIERGKQMAAAAAERDRLAAERKELEAQQQAERDRQAAEQKKLDEQAAKLRAEQAAAKKKAEAERLANLGLHDAVRAVLTHFEPCMDDDSEPQCIKDLRIAFLNDAGTRGVPAQAKKVAAA